MEGISKQENLLEKLYITTLASGEKVYDRPNGHIHENLKVDLPTIIPQINAHRRDFISQVVTLPGRQWVLYKVEVDPSKDNLFLMQRSGREGLSVFVRNRKTETTDKAIVVLSRNDTRKGQPEGYAVITAYSGELTPREPWDAWFTGGYTELEKNKRKVLRQEAFKYWQRYAFIPDEKEFSIIKGVEQTYAPELLNKKVPKKDKYTIV